MYPVEIAFSKSCQRIAEEVKDADKADKAEKGVFEKRDGNMDPDGEGKREVKNRYFLEKKLLLEKFYSRIFLK